ncbi:MAG: tRNA (adenosine(37)-N6)-threonylcarbamoyltransferase complex ATPase subunit type 1 TsaE, partial [Janthinobacterium lividum]|nr:tRNA (adenosine(37)-N6)-threonylcarbamoyltransferase complex ATPase subunit type 1 TsaE [Janthinobacterium lividum]
STVLEAPGNIVIDERSVQVIHFDLYRMGSAEEFLDAGCREDFDGRNICIVEWPEKAEPVLPPADLNVYLSVAGSGRNVELQASSELGLSCLHRLKFAPNL